MSEVNCDEKTKDANSNPSPKVNFDIFVSVFESIYKKYIEKNVAPLEINISDYDRHNLETIFKYIQMKRKNTKNNNKNNKNGKNGKKKENKDENDSNNNNNFNLIFDEIKFWETWQYLRTATNQVIRLLRHSYNRCDISMLSN